MAAVWPPGGRAAVQWAGRRQSCDLSGSRVGRRNVCHAINVDLTSSYGSDQLDLTPSRDHDIRASGFQMDPKRTWQYILVCTVIYPYSGTNALVHRQSQPGLYSEYEYDSYDTY